MKIKVNVEYKEAYLPPRCRKLRYKNESKEVTLNIREITKDDAQIAFIVHDKGHCKKYNDYHPVPEDDIIYYFYKGKLYTLVNWSDKHCGKTGLLPVEELHWYIKGRYDYWNGYFEANKKYFQENAREYLIIDGKVYQRAGEPRYVVNTFGLGHNHGGTGMFVEEFYNPNISNDNYFSALDGELAVAYANKVAAGRGDTNDVGRFKTSIETLMPEVVKVKPKKQHGKGDKFINDLEKVISKSDSAVEAGLLCIAMANLL